MQIHPNFYNDLPSFEPPHWMFRRRPSCHPSHLKFVHLVPHTVPSEPPLPLPPYKLRIQKFRFRRPRRLKNSVKRPKVFPRPRRFPRKRMMTQRSSISAQPAIRISVDRIFCRGNFLSSFFYFEEIKQKVETGHVREGECRCWQT